MRNLRASIYTLHRWSGLFLGLYIAVLGISGAAMVFQAKLYEWEFGADIMAYEDTGPDTTQDTAQNWALPSVWLDKAQQKYGPIEHIEGIFGPETTPMRISAPTIIYDGTRSNGDHGHGVIIVNPYSGEPLARFVAEDTWAIWPLWLHNSMFTGTYQRLTLVLLSGATLLFCFSGLYLWIQRPKVKKQDLMWAGVSSPVATRRSHTALGIWLSVPVIVFAVTGFGLARFDLAMGFAHSLGRADGQFAAKPVSACETESADKAWTTALTINPGADIRMFFLPSERNSGFQVFMGSSAARYPTRGSSEVRMVSQCMEVTYFRPASSNRLGDKLLTYLIDIHNGKIFGFPGELAVFFLGVAAFLLPLLGMAAYLWRTVFQRKT